MAVTFSEAFANWKDFPKGLSVLLVDRDLEFLDCIKSKLESYDYLVTGVSSGQEAQTKLANHTQIFHVALVEATEIGDVDSSKILEFSKYIPTIVISAMENMSLMVTTIALGAVEFLVKPLSEDKLKNIWQHVVRKALDSRDSLESAYLKPGKHNHTSVSLENHRSVDSAETLKSVTRNLEVEDPSGSCSRKIFSTCEKFHEPSTPQLGQDGRMVLEAASLDQSPLSHGSTEGDSHKERTKLESNMYQLSNSYSSADVKNEVSVETVLRLPSFLTVKQENRDLTDEPEIFCCNIPKLGSPRAEKDQNVSETNSMEFKREDQHMVDTVQCKEKRASWDACKHEGCECKSIVENIILKDNGECPNTDSVSSSKSFGHDRKEDKEREDVKRKLNECQENKKDKSSNNKKKIKVDWTAELHRRFVQAVEHLGVDQAIPSRILEVMKVDGLTRHNVASHLQKYRSQKKHHLARESESNNWNQQRFNSSKTWKNGQNPLWIQPRPPIIYPPLHVWGHPAPESPAFPLMSPHMRYSSTWPAPENLMWKRPVVDACVPGIPCGSPSYSENMKCFQTVPGYVQGSTFATSATPEDVENLNFEATNRHEDTISQDSKELLDAAISEVLNNPRTPLPLGLKPPSMEGVMAELQRQGINTVSLHVK